MNLINRIENAYRAFTGQSRPVLYGGPPGSVRKLENIKSGVIPPQLQQYAKFIVTPPAFYTYWTFYQIFTDVQTPVDRVAKRVGSLGGRFYTKDGEVDDDLTDKLYKQYGLRELTEEYILDHLIYGQALVAEFETNDGIQDTDRFQVIPSHEITLWQANLFDFDRVTWHWEYRTIDIEKEDMRLFRFPSINSKYFGKSPFNSFYDDLNQLNLDRDNFNQFLENNSFFGVAIMPKEGISDDEFQSLVQTAKQLNDPRTRYTAGVYQYVDRFETLKQEIQARLTTEEKRYIAVRASNAVGYPYQLLKESSSGLGQGEQKTIMLNYKDETIDPLQDKVYRLMNEFVLTKLGINEQYTWKADEMTIDSLADMFKIANTGFLSGLFDAKEAKLRYLGYKEEDLEYRDETAGGDGRTVEETETREEIKSMMKIEQVREMIENQKALNGNDKKRIKKLLQRIKTERDDGFSPVEIVIDNDKAKELEELIYTAMTDQFKDFDFIINKKSVDADDEITLEEVEEELNPLVNYIDVALLAYYINYLMNIGRLDGISQLEELGLELTDTERAEINREIANYANARTESLLGFPNSESSIQDIDQPEVPQSLDTTTAKWLFTILSMATTRVEAEALFKKRLAERVQMIRETEAGRAYNAGLLIVAKKKPEIGYIWMRTRSQDPREIHLALVGEYRPAGQLFNGEWPGVRINCKCSVKLTKRNV